MAALNIKPLTGVGGGTTNLLSNLPATAEKNKQWQRELLMERIRSHSSQHKTFPELSKAMRMGMLEKRYPLDAVEKANLQKCLDNMQHCIKVTSRQGLVERLESLSRQLSLKFSDDSKALFISTDMFYLEILLDSNGSLTDVKVHHESKVEQQSCSELVDCLNRGDFADFTAQLEGFSSIYQLNAESKVKIKAYDAMQAMETDLYNIFQMQNFSKDAAQILQDSAVGIVMQRRGGHPMRLVYFVSPYDLISVESKTLQPITLDTFNNKSIGFSVTVNLEASSANKLQILPTVTLSKDPQTGMDMPAFAPLTQMNSMLLPATFVLRLNKPLPVCYNTLRAMGLCPAAGNENSPSMSTSLESQNKPPVVSNIMSLIIQTASDQQTKTNQKGLFVHLPDQTHCYYFTENKLMKSTLIHSVPFTEPSQVHKILEFLKKMALFYSLLASCVRPQAKVAVDLESTTVLEVNAISFQQISVALQHPYEESMATVEFDLRSGKPQCSIYSISHNYELLSIKLTSIAQKCLSIPVTIRALLKFWDQERMNMFQHNMGGTATTGMGSSGPNISGGAGGAGSGGVGTGNLGNTHTSYGNFNITGGGTNDPGGGGGGGGMQRMSSGSMPGGVNIKLEPNAGNNQQQQRSLVGPNAVGGLLPQMSTASAAAAGYMKYKNPAELKQEDFHESPKSQINTTINANLVAESMAASNLMQSNLEINSLGHHQQTAQQQQQLEQQIAEHEIADKYKNIWKDKTTSLKNTVSITPISADNTATTTTSSPSLDVKRTGGIEIIPLVGQGNNNSNSPINAGGSTTITITPINAGSTSTSPAHNNNKDKKPSNSPSYSSGSSGGAVVMNNMNSLVANINTSSTSTSSSTSSTSSSKRNMDGSAEGQKEKKRKKRRDDSPMGPPEKIFSRQNSPAGSSDASAGSRKFPSPSSSPKGSSGGLLASSVTGSSLSARPSPKHSPVYSSPKHNTASNSPKSPFGTHSPKHGSSGKPSMSTLKSAAAASPKGDKSSNSSVSSVSASSVLNSAALVRSMANSNTSSSSCSALGTSSATANTNLVAAVKSAAAAAVKSSMGVNSAQMQQMKNVPGLSLMSAAAASNFSTGSTGSNSVSGLDLNSAMRKGVTTAVSLMTSTPAIAATTISKSPTLSVSLPGGLERPDKVKQPRPQVTVPMSHPGISEERASKMKSSNGNNEYMVKTSQEGLKMTINKTSSSAAKVSSSSTASLSSSYSSSSLNTNSKFSLKTSQRGGSPSLHVSSSSSTTSSGKKPHTGLKPGVSSGPASKKSTSSTGNSSRSSSKHSFQKSNSSGSLSTKSSSPSSGFGLSKSHSTNSFGDYPRKSFKKSHSASTSPALPTPYTSSSHSQPASLLDHQADMLKILHYASPTMAANMEGFMKGLNSKFQIPKLSQRNNASTTTTTTSATNSSTTASSTTADATHPAAAINDNNKKSNAITSSAQTQSSVSVHILKSPATNQTPSSSATSLLTSNSNKSTTLNFLHNTSTSPATKTLASNVTASSHIAADESPLMATSAAAVHSTSKTTPPLASK
ncbi:mediator of RNA polymerase II transcription subunit 1 [Musca domestica]|uniref:Mediator of RNA polymerase II transcription subunit 1 n=3 Tax=Musca domestica TaxID=7370 RepID=A0A1I8NF68_MUSDO|nr:mediator of RNA polymerase II transcription subunit 1 [Musca domestica]